MAFYLFFGPFMDHSDWLITTLLERGNVLALSPLFPLLSMALYHLPSILIFSKSNQEKGTFFHPWFWPSPFPFLAPSITTNHCQGVQPLCYVSIWLALEPQPLASGLGLTIHRAQECLLFGPPSSFVSIAITNYHIALPSISSVASTALLHTL